MDEEFEYEVGYKKPPKKSQFKKGKSGNPKGRKKGSKNKHKSPYDLPPKLFSEAVLAEASREVEINENGKKIKVPIQTAIIRSINVNAARGDVKSQRLFATLITKEEKEREEEALKHTQALLEYKQYWQERLDKGCKGPIDGPLPDQIRVNTRTGKVEVVGPFLREDRKKNAFYLKMLSNHRETLSTLKESLANAENAEEREASQEEIKHFEKTISILENIVFEDSEDLSPYERAKREGYLKPFMKGPEAMKEFCKKKFNL